MRVCGDYHSCVVLVMNLSAIVDDAVVLNVHLARMRGGVGGVA